MVRGATARFKFKLPYPQGEFVWVTIKFWQPGNNGTTTLPLPITKTKDHCERSNIYFCKLTENISEDKSYYFKIFDNIYGFDGIAISADTTLTFDINNTETISFSSGVIATYKVDNIIGKTELTFINETDLSNELCIMLDPTETIRFSDKIKARVQMRAQHKSGIVIPTHMEYITVYPINDDLASDDLGGGGTIADDSGWVVLDGGAII